MAFLPKQFMHEELWEVINETDKFELISFLLVGLLNPGAEWYKTPKTRDNKRDGEGYEDSKKILFEAKFFYDHKNKKLAHKEVGSNINVAIYEMADVLWIFTNGEIQLDLLNFVRMHNEIHEQILREPLRIITVNGQQSAMLIMKFSKDDFQNQLSKLKFTGYKSLNELQISQRRDELIDQGTDLTEKINEVKTSEINSFFYYPTLQGLGDYDWGVEERLTTIESLFQVEIFYDWTQNGKGEQTISVPVGSPFFILIKISNYFFNQVDFRLYIKPNGFLKLMAAFEPEGNSLAIDGHIEPVSDKVIALEVRVDHFPFEGLEGKVGVHGIDLKLNAGQISVQNVFFLAPFIGEKNNETLALFKEKIDRTHFKSKFFLALITGRAGVGKSRLIQEILDHSTQYDSRVFRSELLAPEGRKTFIASIISYFLGVDANSFIDIGEQLIARFATDQSFSSLFKTKKEFTSFKKLISNIFDVDFDFVTSDQLETVADFITKLLFRFGQKYLTVAVVEDLHHADKHMFHFISRLYNNLKTQPCKVVILLAARTEATEYSRAYEEFESMVESDPTYSVSKVNVSELSDSDSLVLVKELVITESKFERQIKRKVLSKTGNNPFNIIHTLLHLRNRGIIIEKANDFEWRYINRLDDPNLHLEVEDLWKHRFSHYATLPMFNSHIVQLLQIMCLFESKVNLESLQDIWVHDQLTETINFLAQERILRASGGSIQFDHENILQYVSEKYLETADSAAEMIVNWIKFPGRDGNYLRLLVRSMNASFEQYSAKFFESCFELFEILENNDDWKGILRYGGMIVEKGNNLDSAPLSKLFAARFSIAYIQSEHSGVNVAINQYEQLEMEIENFVGNVNLIGDKESFDCYIIGLKAKLYRSDSIIMTSDYLKARTILQVLIAEIQNFKASNGVYKDEQQLREFEAWALNRLGITFRPLGQPDIALEWMGKSLKLSQEIGHQYYIHHNYYDMAGCLIHLNRLDEAFEIHQRCITKVLQKPEHLNAKVRTNVRTGVFYTLLGQYANAEVELEAAIQLARSNNFFWELTRGLINQGCLYIKSGYYKPAYETFKTCLHYLDIHNAQGFKLCVYSNLAFLHLHTYKTSGQDHFLSESLDAMLKVIECVVPQNGLHQVDSQSSYYLLACMNIISFQKFVLDMPEKAWWKEKRQKLIDAGSPATSSVDRPFLEMFREKLDKGPDFYLLFMSFS
jgi:tetratricopeptide (TPR) repeat protein